MATLKDLSGQAAVVTGGARGIGRAICEALLDKKVSVCVADVLEETGLATLKELQKKYGVDHVIFKKCDVTSDKDLEEAMTATIKAFGRFDIMVNNAGILGEKDWKQTIKINLGGVIQGTYLAFQHLQDNTGKKGGTVINTASTAGLCPIPAMPVYASTKHAVLGFTKCWGEPSNVKKTGVKVNAVCPDSVTTPMQEELFNRPDDVCVSGEDARKHYAVAKDHSLTPLFVSTAFIKLLEDDVTGQLLVASLTKGLYYQEYENYK